MVLWCDIAIALPKPIPYNSSATTQKLHAEKYALRKPVMMDRLQNPLQQEPTSCKQSPSVSRMKWQLLKPQYWCIICLDVLFLLFSL